MPGAGKPTLPIRIAFGGLIVPHAAVSLMPHISLSGSPSAWKNSMTETGQGADATAM